MTVGTESARARVRAALGALDLAATAHRRAMRRRLRVGEEELSALLYLAHHGGVPQRRLACASALSRSGAGAMIQRLEERGYVQRETDPSDRRLRVVTLSPAGRERIDDAYADFDAALDGRGDDQLDALAELLTALAQAAHAPHEPAADDSTRAPDDGEPIWRRWA
jgi:DNA-binding MarR family transcriptional regulator